MLGQEKQPNCHSYSASQAVAARFSKYKLLVAATTIRLIIYTLDQPPNASILSMANHGQPFKSHQISLIRPYYPPIAYSNCNRQVSRPASPWSRSPMRRTGGDWVERGKGRNHSREASYSNGKLWAQALLGTAIGSQQAILQKDDQGE